VLALAVQAKELFDLIGRIRRHKTLGSAQFLANFSKALSLAEELERIPRHVILNERVHLNT